LHQIAPALDARKYRAAGPGRINATSCEENDVSAQLSKDRQKLWFFESNMQRPPSVLALPPFDAN